MMSSDSNYQTVSSDDEETETMVEPENLNSIVASLLEEEIPPVMSLWQQVQQLPRPYLEQVQSHYESSLFPLEVRHCFADWIEAKKWDIIEETDGDTAESYLNEMIREIDIKIQDFSNDYNYFTIRMKLENASKDFKRLFGDDPFKFIRVVKRCLDMEKTCIESHKERRDFVSMSGYQMNKDSERTQIFIKLKQMTQATATDVQNLQQIQESFILKYQNFLRNRSQVDEMRKKSADNVKAYEQKLLQIEAEISHENKIVGETRILLLNKHTETYECLNKLTMEILENDLMEWLQKQQLHGTNAETEELIDDIQKWCSQLAEFIWENRQQIKKSILMQKQLQTGGIDYTNLNDSITDLLSQLVTRTFIVLKQPNQILKKESGRFSASVTLLVGRVLNVDKNPPEVTAILISELEASQLSSNSANKKEANGCILNSTGTMELINDRYMTVTFRNMQLKRIKRTERKTTEAVTEEKFALFFCTKFRVLGEELTFYVWTVSNPVVVTVHGNQECKATATILWDNHFAEPSRIRFKVPDQVPWVKCAELLSYKFKKDVGVVLKHQDLQYLATKVFGGTIEDDFTQFTITWNLFSKENMKGKNFTFWEWFHAIVKLTKEQLVDLYKDDLIAGFIGKQQAQQMLLQQLQGTFLLRFSDNQIGGITIAWLGMNEGKANVWNLRPYDLNSLKIRSLAQRVQDLHDLTYLYPGLVKRDTFTKYLDKETDKQDRMLAHGYVPTILKDHIETVSNNESSPLSDVSFLNFTDSMDIEFDELTPNMDYSADDVNQLLGSLEYESKYNIDNLNCR